jgi:hypothetical protein
MVSCIACRSPFHWPALALTACGGTVVQSGNGVPARQGPPRLRDPRRPRGPRPRRAPGPRPRRAPDPRPRPARLAALAVRTPYAPRAGHLPAPPRRGPRVRPTGGEPWPPAPPKRLAGRTSAHAPECRRRPPPPRRSPPAYATSKAKVSCPVGSRARAPGWGLDVVGEAGGPRGAAPTVAACSTAPVCSTA